MTLRRDSAISILKLFFLWATMYITPNKSIMMPSYSKRPRTRLQTTLLHAPSRPKIPNLPNDVRSLILSRLSLKDLASATSVSRQFASAPNRAPVRKIIETKARIYVKRKVRADGWQYLLTRWNPMFYPADIQRDMAVIPGYKQYIDHVKKWSRRSGLHWSPQHFMWRMNFDAVVFLSRMMRLPFTSAESWFNYASGSSRANVALMKRWVEGVM